MKKIIIIKFILFANLLNAQNTYDENIYHQISHSTVQIIADKIIDTLKTGEIRIKRGRGTGFFCNLNYKGKEQTFLVTNKHVVDSCDYIRMVLTYRKSDGNADVGNNFEIYLDSLSKLWIYHPNPNVDLAILPAIFINLKAYELGKSPYYKTISKSFFANTEDWKELSPMTNIMMIGYPKGLIDNINNTPIFRQGITATSPQLDYKGKSEFMIDIASFHGSSGSPIFEVERKSKQDINSTIFFTKIKLIGILYAGVFSKNRDDTIIIESSFWDSKPNGKEEKVPLNLGIAIKVSELLEFENLK